MNTNQLINGVALFDKSIIKEKCLQVRDAIANARAAKLEKFYAEQKVEADKIREKYQKSFWYRFKLKRGKAKDVNQLSNKDVVLMYKKDIRSTDFGECLRLFDFAFGDEDIAAYKRDTMKLCNELLSVCDALKGDEIWISSQAWSKLNEK
jgi:anaerobic ribonucleoside-triphosphate reductase